MDTKTNTNLAALERRVGYKFKNRNLLKRALCHSSYANENHDEMSESNERLEFLGDSVLGFVTADSFYSNYKKLPEGDLTKLRASTVCEKSLHEFAVELGLGEFLMLGKGELCTGGRERTSILADAFEALIAAIYIDGGMDAAKGFVLKYVNRALKQHNSFKDYKTMLQEVVQKNPEEDIEYVLTDETGPDHDKRFTVEVHLNSNVIGKGIGKSKKKAEQEAAKEALALMGL